MNSTLTAGKETGSPRHSPVFLGVFAIFLIATAICLMGTVLGVAAAQPSHHDTQWFWASGHLLAQGKNPYDQTSIRHIETSLGLQIGSDLPMTRNPPPALFLMMPLGFLRPRTGVIGWSLLLVAFLILAMQSMGATLRAPYHRAYIWLAWCFAPALCCIEVGQMGLILLFGLAFFLRFHESRPICAGAALSLCAVKPHLFIPFGLVLLLWTVAKKRQSILAGAILALMIESLVPMAFDHHVWSQYLAAMHTQNFVGEYVPTLGVALRFFTNRTAMWVEFVPSAAACLWGIWYFWRNRDEWDWRTHGSLLTLVSLAAAPYSWFTDQVIALPAILFVLLGPQEPRRGSLTLLMAIMSAGAVEMMISSSLFFKPYLWEGVAWLAWYVYAVSGRAAAADEVMQPAVVV